MSVLIISLSLTLTPGPLREQTGICGYPGHDPAKPVRKHDGVCSNPGVGRPREDGERGELPGHPVIDNSWPGDNNLNFFPLQVVNIIKPFTAVITPLAAYFSVILTELCR